jgi:ABC-type branched-subunit amino acid transport system substrate-binding protein
MMWRCMRIAAASLLVLGPAAQAAPDTPVKIGVLGDQSSVYSAAGGRGSVEAAKLAAEDAGLVLGKPVEIVSADFQLKVDVGVAIARKWYDEEGVDAIIDVPFSGLALANDPNKEEAGSLQCGGEFRANRREVLTLRRAMDVRHLFAGTWADHRACEPR